MCFVTVIFSIISFLCQVPFLASGVFSANRDTISVINILIISAKVAYFGVQLCTKSSKLSAEETTTAAEEIMPEGSQHTDPEAPNYVANPMQPSQSGHGDDANVPLLNKRMAGMEAKVDADEQDGHGDLDVEGAHRGFR